MHLHDARASASAGVRLVHQDLALAQQLSVLENVALGREFARGLAGRWRDQRRKTQALIDSLGYASKAGVIPLTKVTAVDLAPRWPSSPAFWHPTTPASSPVRRTSSTGGALAWRGVHE